MLRGFAAWMKETDPDVISGWNFLDFDLPYLIRRMEMLGLDPSTLARLSGPTERNTLRGRAVFDLLSAYRKMQGAQRNPTGWMPWPSPRSAIRRSGTGAPSASSGEKTPACWWNTTSRTSSSARHQWEEPDHRVLP